MKNFLFAAILFAAFSVSAQNVEVSSQGFPNIQLKIASEKKLSKDNVKLTQNGQDLEFQLVKQGSEQEVSAQGTSVYFLIETSGFTSNAIINNFKTGINDFVRKSPDGLAFNASSFWKANTESKILNNLSVDFTNKKDAFAEEIKQKIKPVVDSQQQADIHKAIYDALDYINKNAPTIDKKLVVLTAGVNKSYSPIKIDDCIEKASQSNVQVFSLVYKTGYAYALDNLKKLSDKTEAKSLLVSSSKEITDALEDFVKVDATMPATTSIYEIKFTLPNPKEITNLSINIDGKNQNINITPPQTEQKTEAKTDNKLFFIAVGAIAFLVVGFLMYKKQQKTKQKREEEQKALKAQLEQQQQQFQQEQQRLQQQILQQKQTPTQVKEEPKKEEAQKFDPKKTYIGGGGGTPTLSVSGQGFQQNFLLHKPTMTIGRKEGNDIIIPIETVSSNHAVLTNEAGNWFIADNNSTNGIILNGNKIQKHILKQGDKIQLGGALMTFQLA